MNLVNILGNKQYLSIGIFESKFQLSKILWRTLTKNNSKNIDKKDLNSDRLIKEKKEYSNNDENIDKNDINYSDFFWKKQKEPNYNIKDHNYNYIWKHYKPIKKKYDVDNIFRKKE